MFGANQSGSLFGTPKSSGLTFGTPSAAVSTPAGFSAFGSNNPSTIGSAGTLFSSTSLSNATPSLGATAFTGFGSQPAATKTGFSFGQQPTTSTTMAGGSTTGLFGGLATANPTTGFTGLGTTPNPTPGFTGLGMTANPTPGFTGLGATANPTAGFTGLGTSAFGLSAPSTSTLTTGFGTAVQPSAPSLSLGTFGAPTSVAGMPSIGLGTTLTSSLGTTPFSSLSTMTSTAAPSLGLGMFGTAAPTTTTPSLALGLFGSSVASTSTTTSDPVLGLGGAQPAPSAVIGLGGVNAAQTAAATGDAKHESKALKEYPVPPEIVALTENFKKYIKEQKSVKEEISRISSKSLFKVQEESASLKQLLSIISNGIQRNIASIRQLKDETIQELKNAEIMQRTKDVPLALQYENTSPMEYFQKLFASFEVKMQMYRQQINMMEKHLASSAQPFNFTPQELMMTVKQLHETFVYLAAELQTINENVKKQKDRYLTYRRLVHGETSNVFESVSRATRSSKSSQVPVTIGPSPFSGAQSANIAAFVSAVEKAQQPSSGAPPTFGLSSNSLQGTQLGFSSGLSGTNTFGAQSFLTGNNPSLMMSGSSLAMKPLGK